MFKRKAVLAGLLVTIVLPFTYASTAHSAGGVGGGVGGGMGGIGGGGMPGIGGGGLPAANVASGLGPIFRMPQRFRDVNVAGQVGVDQSKLPATATIIRLRLDGRDIPMRLDTELQGADLQFDPHEGYARDLYQSILTKRVEVVGDQDLRDEVARAAETDKPLRIEGYVFDRTSPYLVLKSIKEEY
jgi:hypothetical protein